MTVEGKTRRGVLAAAMGAAVVGPLLLAHRRGLATIGDDSIRVVRGRDGVTAAGGSASDGAAEGWAARVGEVFELGLPAGAAAMTLVAATATLAYYTRPAGIRRQSLELVFATDRIGAPAGDSIYPVGRPIEGLTALFFQRGRDIGDKATLIALFD